MTYETDQQPQDRDNSDIVIELGYDKQLHVTYVHAVDSLSGLGEGRYRVSEGLQYNWTPPDLAVTGLVGDVDLFSAEDTLRFMQQHGAVGVPGESYGWVEAAQPLRRVQTAAEFWLAWKAGGDVRWPYYCESGEMPTREDALHRFVQDLADGARRLIYDYPVYYWDAENANNAFMNWDEEQDHRPLDLVDKLWGQLHNVVLSGLSPMQCANETCHDPRPFVFKRDPHTLGEKVRTKGVKYCSINCGTIQGRRERNRAKVRP